MREVVTVQVGGFANYVGAHFWNFQDEALGTVEDAGQVELPTTGLDMDVLYRVGETRQGIATYTPRMLAFDLRGSLGAVRAAGSLYERTTQPAVTTWSGPSVTHRQEPIEKNDFLKSLDEESEGWTPGNNTSVSDKAGAAGSNRSEDITTSEGGRERTVVHSLDDSVQFWTDYLKAHLHPRSIYELPNTFYGVTPFDNYGCGLGYFKEQEQREEVENRLRFFVEECDHLQGFQFLVDTSGGFAGVAADFLTELGDEYSRSTKLLFALRPPWTPPAVVNHRDFVIASLHESVSLARLSSLSNLFVPAGLQQLASSRFARYLCVDDSKLFHTSAVYATAVNTITLPFRMEPSGPTASSQERGVGSSDMSNTVRLVSCSQQKKLALLEASLPAPSVPVPESHDSLDLTSLAPLTPDVDDSDFGTQAAEALVIQGARLAGGRGPASIAQVLACTYTGRTAVRRGALSLCQLSVSPSPLPIPLPFPCTFGPYISPQGNILPNPVSRVPGRGGLDILSVPVAARMSSSDALLPYAKSRLLNFRKLGLSRVSVGASVLKDWGFDEEEAQDLAEILGNLVAAYGERAYDTTTDSD